MTNETKPTFKLEFIGLEGCCEGQSWIVTSSTENVHIQIDKDDDGEWVGEIVPIRRALEFDYGGDMICQTPINMLWRDYVDVLVVDLLKGVGITDFNLVAEGQPIFADMFSPEVA